MKLHDRIEKRKVELDKEIEPLVKANNELFDKRGTLETELDVALMTGEDKDIDFIGSEIDRLTIEINRNERRLRTMRSGTDPVVKIMIVEEIKKLNGEVKEMETAAFNKITALEAKRNDLLNDMRKIAGVYEKANRHRYWASKWTDELSREDLEHLGIKKSDAVSNIAKELNGLMITPAEVYNK